MKYLNIVMLSLFLMQSVMGEDDKSKTSNADKKSETSDADKLTISRFPLADGDVWIGGYFELDKGRKGRIYYRYCSISDSGILIERVTAKGESVWKRLIKPLGTKHSKYTHRVEVSLGRRGDLVAFSRGYLDIVEHLDLSTGKQLSRKVTPVGK